MTSILLHFPASWMVFELSPTSLMLYSWFAPPNVAETGNASKVTVQLLAWVSSFTVPVAAPSLYNSTLTLSTGAALSFPKKFCHFCYFDISGWWDHWGPWGLFLVGEREAILHASFVTNSIPFACKLNAVWTFSNFFDAILMVCTAECRGDW